MPTPSLVAAGRLPLLAKIFLEELLRDLDMDAGAVAGLAVGIDGAAMPDRLQRRDAGLHHLPPRLAVDGRDESDAAGIMLFGGIVHAVRGEMRGVAAPAGNQIIGHDSIRSIKKTRLHHASR